MASTLDDVVRSSHHQQLPLCESRPSYRQGRKLTAVKVQNEAQVYTISDESKHILLVGVPSIGLHDQVKQLCQRYGDVQSVVFVPNYADEEFTDVFHVQYSKLQSSRFAKRQLDSKEFYGGVLHVCYVPEMESVEETRQKLIQRRREVAVRCSKTSGSYEKNKLPLRQYQRKPLKTSGSSVLNVSSLKCVWNGQPQNKDPRHNFVLANTYKAYGPQLPGPEWKEAGLRERYIQPKKLKSSNETSLKNHTEGSGKPSQRTGRPLEVIDKTVLRFIPRQVKGVQKKAIIEDKKLEELPSTSTGNKSMDSTIQAIRDKIRKVSVPNIKIHLSGREESALTTKEDTS